MLSIHLTDIIHLYYIGYIISDCYTVQCLLHYIGYIISVMLYRYYSPLLYCPMSAPIGLLFLLDTNAFPAKTLCMYKDNLCLLLYRFFNIGCVRISMCQLYISTYENLNRYNVYWYTRTLRASRNKVIAEIKEMKACDGTRWSA